MAVDRVAPNHQSLVCCTPDKKNIFNVERSTKTYTDDKGGEGHRRENRGEGAKVSKALNMAVCAGYPHLQQNPSRNRPPLLKKCDMGESACGSGGLNPQSLIGETHDT